MKVLLVEDNKSYSATLKDLITALPTGPSVELAESRNVALELLEREFYDVVILDLEIPTIDDAFDLEVAHGEQVFYHARKYAPGTPVYILTGSEPGSFLRGLVRQGQSVDLWGDGEVIPTVDYYHKEDVVQLFTQIKKIAETIATTDSIKINKGIQNIELGPEQNRVLKIFTRSNGGTSCKITRLGGLSDAVVLKVSVRDLHGNVRCESVGKLGLAKHVNKEITAYDAEVKHLRLGAFAPVISHHDQGLRGFSGIFYALADEYKNTFFDLVSKDIIAAREVLARIKPALSRWTDIKKVEMIEVSEIRRRILSDEAFDRIIEEHKLQHLKKIDAAKIEISASCIHGDLHGGNILVNAEGVPVLIDFGDVGPGFSCLDPLTLELSLYFHPDAISCGLAALLEDSIENWADLDIYLKNNPLKPIIQFCREWAYDLGPHDESVIIVAYVFTLRQLKYKTVNANKTIKLLNNILGKININGQPN